MAPLLHPQGQLYKQGQRRVAVAEVLLMSDIEIVDIVVLLGEYWAWALVWLHLAMVVLWWYTRGLDAKREAEDDRSR
jgi:hypothetical protein